MSPAPERIIEALKRIVEPGSSRDLIRNDMVRDLHIAENTVGLTVMVSDPGSAFAKELPD